MDSNAAAPVKRHLFFRIINFIMDTTAWLCVATILVVIALQVLFREMGRPLVWTEEGSRFLFIWMFYLGMAIGYRKAETARVTIFVKLVPWLCGMTSVVIYVVFSLVFFFIVIYTGMQLLEQQIMFSEMAVGFPLPLWIVGLILPISGFFGVCSLVESLIYSWDTVYVKREGKA